MKNWANLDADINKIMNKHYTKGRAGRKIKHVVIHHNAGNLTVEGCWNVWQTREASAHYQVEKNGRIGQLVWDSDTAWHAGNLAENYQSIGIEHANSGGAAQGWPISNTTVEEGAHLTAAICVKHKLGRPMWMVNVFPHNHFKATSCPGHLAGDLNTQFMTRAQYWYDQMTGKNIATKTAAKIQTAIKKATTANPTAGKSIDTLAREVIAGKWGNGTARKTALGAKYNQVQARVNQIMTSKPATKTVDEIAREVIAGKWGNGAARQSALAKAGYSYSAVQNRVNQILLG